MRAPSEKLDLLLNAVETNTAPSVRRGALVPFMLDCAALIRPSMPSVARESFRVSIDFEAKRISVQLVQAAIERCWDELRDACSETDLDNPEVCAIRAVICILRRQLEPESEDFLDYASFFLRLVNRVEPHEREEERLLLAHFGVAS